MHPITKKQKIQYILAAAGFVLLALALLFLLLEYPSGGKSDADAAPTPEVTAAPSASAGLTIAGVDVDPAADSFELAGKTLSAGDCASIASLGNLTTLSLTNCNISDVHFLSGLTRSCARSFSPITPWRTLRRSPRSRSFARCISTGIRSPTFPSSRRSLHSRRSPFRAWRSRTMYSKTCKSAARLPHIQRQRREGLASGVSRRAGLHRIGRIARPFSRGITDISALSGCSELRELNSRTTRSPISPRSPCCRSSPRSI